MNAVLLTLIASLGATGGPGYVESHAAYQHGGAIYASAAGEACADCGDGDCRNGHCGHGHKPHGGWCGMMPQTCYNPTFGCYGDNRHTHRYPAFHGTYYRRPYNYRNVFDYPWHAELHEPTSHFAYNVEESAATLGVPVGPAPIVSPQHARPAEVPTPVPDAQGRYQGRQSTTLRPASFLKRSIGR